MAQAVQPKAAKKSASKSKKTTPTPKDTRKASKKETQFLHDAEETMETESPAVARNADQLDEL